ncbi:MAG: hypothetical protein AVDCRST_MAG40-3464 [uncultured Gemmatimonadaceae bacterium]|uniref:Uncharacterized protein n=1 Tax=uncultured Gemmatimonadaceae bacterium TaxID=246130 RepID=A0A6J4MKV8_9BACT|nr:MAG: hypothetical protein AVDCRST_MAG40-3464 [uncultured Gemmatimonadaceae bacterium]
MKVKHSFRVSCRVSCAGDARALATRRVERAAPRNTHPRVRLAIRISSLASRHSSLASRQSSPPALPFRQ